MQRRIAIVGANGFVGRHLAEYARLQGHEVLGIVRSPRAAQVVEALGADPLLLADLGRDATRGLLGKLEGCAGLVYTASVSVGPGSEDRTDPQGLLNVVEVSRISGVERMVFFSGLGVARYGLNPYSTNPYFLAKMAGETALFRSGLPATVLRPSYIFGWGDDFLTPLMKRMMKNPVVEVPGDGQYRLQPISVKDTARVILGVLEARGPSAQVVDLVGPEAITFRALIARIAAVMGRTVELRPRAIEEAMDRARASDYFGLRAHELACLLCDEVSDSSQAALLAGGRLDDLDSVIAATLAAVKAEPGH